MKPLYYLFLILLFSGCSPERAIERATGTKDRAEKTQNRLKEKYPDLVAEKFAEWFPVTETEKVVRDTVSVPVYLKAEALPGPESRPETYRPVRTGSYRPVVSCPDLSYYTNALTELRQKNRKSAAALEAAKARYRKVQHALFQEQTAHASTKAAAEKARKLKTGWLWFNIFLALLIVWFVIGKIFRFI